MHSFVTKDRKVLDYRYERIWDDVINFSVGDIFLGQIFKMGNRQYTAVPFKGKPLAETVNGFGTRSKAVEYLIQVCMKGE